MTVLFGDDDQGEDGMNKMNKNWNVKKKMHGIMMGHIYAEFGIGGSIISDIGCTDLEIGGSRSAARSAAGGQAAREPDPTQPPGPPRPPGASQPPGPSRPPQPPQPPQQSGGPPPGGDPDFDPHADGGDEAQRHSTPSPPTFQDFDERPETDITFLKSLNSLSIVALENHSNSKTFQESLSGTTKESFS